MRFSKDCYFIPVVNKLATVTDHRNLLDDIVRDAQANETGRCTLRAQTFFGVTTIRQFDATVAR